MKKTVAENREVAKFLLEEGSEEAANQKGERDHYRHDGERDHELHDGQNRPLRVPRRDTHDEPTQTIFAKTPAGDANLETTRNFENRKMYTYFPCLLRHPDMSHVTPKQGTTLPAGFADYLGIYMYPITVRRDAGREPRQAAR